MNILIDNISKQYNGKQVLKDVSLKITKGSKIALLGPSGSGKTTLLRIIADLEKPDSGHIKGFSQKDTAFMFQEPRLFPWLTAVENIACVLNIKKSVAQKEATDWLKKVKLDHDGSKYPSELSGGMNRRIALARTLAYKKSLFLLDEPFYGLDAELKSYIIELTAAEIREKTVVFITHDIKEAESFGDRIVYLDQINHLQAAN